MASKKDHTFIRLEIPMDTLLDHELEMVEQRLQLESRERKNVQKRTSWILQALTNQYLFEKHGIVNGGGVATTVAEPHRESQPANTNDQAAASEPTDNHGEPDAESKAKPVLNHLANAF